MPAIQIDPYTLVVERTCSKCGCLYSIGGYAESNESYFFQPERYIDGCESFCLACWLGVGPNDEGGVAEVGSKLAEPPVTLAVEVPYNELRDGRFHVLWPYDDCYEAIVRGNLLEGHSWFLHEGWHLAVLPISRVKVTNPVFFPNGGAIYPSMIAQLDGLNPRQNQKDAESLAERCSEASGIDMRTIERLPAVVIPVRFDWDAFVAGNHDTHLALIRDLSECVDRTFLNFMRYRKCRLDRPESLPSRAGLVRDDVRMAGALVYNHAAQEARIVGGTAFRHVITRGLGMALTQVEWNEMPHDGETGRLVDHALYLYAGLLEAESDTARFMQATGLLEYLAFPSEFRPLKKVRAVVTRYAARTPAEHEQMMKRFQNDLFGPNGYRTQIVHNGKRIEQLLSAAADRLALLRELDGYIRPMIDDMIEHSEMPWNEYIERRKHIGCVHANDDEWRAT